MFAHMTSGEKGVGHCVDVSVAARAEEGKPAGTDNVLGFFRAERSDVAFSDVSAHSTGVSESAVLRM